MPVDRSYARAGRQPDFGRDVKRVLARTPWLDLLMEDLNEKPDAVMRFMSLDRQESTGAFWHATGTNGSVDSAHLIGLSQSRRMRYASYLSLHISQIFKNLPLQECLEEPTLVL